MIGGRQREKKARRCARGLVSGTTFSGGGRQHEDQIARITRRTCVILIAPTVRAQDMPDIGFKSVGRGQPLAAKVLERQGRGPGMDPRSQSPTCPRIEGHHEAYAGWISPRCAAKELQAPAAGSVHQSRFLRQTGAVERPPLFPLQCQPVHRAAARHSGPARNEHHQQDEDGPVGPLRVRLSAQGHRQPLRLPRPRSAHYEALLEETKKRGGPNKYSWKDFPAAEWNGEYKAPRDDASGTAELVQGCARSDSHDSFGAHAGISAAYGPGGLPTKCVAHPLWPSTFCWAGGLHAALLFRAAVREALRAGHARMSSRSRRVSRATSSPGCMSAASSIWKTCPRAGRRAWLRGAALGTASTIGFWDKDTPDHHGPASAGMEVALDVRIFQQDAVDRDLIRRSATSPAPFSASTRRRFSTIRRRSPSPSASCVICTRWPHYSDSKETPQTFIECVQTIYNINGINSPLQRRAPKVEVEVPDMYGRPLGQDLGHRSFEKDMKRPDHSEELFNFNEERDSRVPPRRRHPHGYDEGFRSRRSCVRGITCRIRALPIVRRHHPHSIEVRHAHETQTPYGPAPHAAAHGIRRYYWRAAGAG